MRLVEFLVTTGGILCQDQPSQAPQQRAFFSFSYLAPVLERELLLVPYPQLRQ